MAIKRLFQVCHIQLIETLLLVIMLVGGFRLAPFIMVAFLIIGLTWRYIVKSNWSLTYLCLYHVITSVYIMYVINMGARLDEIIIATSLLVLYKALTVFFVLKIATNEAMQKERNKVFLYSQRKLNLSKLQKCILIVYVIAVLWVSVFNVTWIARFKQDSKTQIRVSSSIFTQPTSAMLPGSGQRAYAIEYAYIDTNQIGILLFATTVTGGVFFVLSMALIPRS